jgi:hypothetical protein
MSVSADRGDGGEVGHPFVKVNGGRRYRVPDVVVLEDARIRRGRHLDQPEGGRAEAGVQDVVAHHASRTAGCGRVQKVECKRATDARDAGASHRQQGVGV